MSILKVASKKAKNGYTFKVDFRYKTNGITTRYVKSGFLTKKEAIRCNGKVYSEEHRRRFEIKNDVFKVEKSSVDDNKLVLTINRQPISEWFKEQWEKLRQGLRQSTEESRKSRGFRM